MSQTITFGTPRRYWNDNGKCRLAHPYPAKAHLPEWFKELGRYSPCSEPNGFPNRTVKMCPPFLEAMTHGYVIPAPFDFDISIDVQPDGSTAIVQRLADDIDQSDYPDWIPILGRLPSEPFYGSPWQNVAVFKFRDYWRIETPPGYSCFCFDPLNRNDDELPFQVIPTIFDTDNGQTTITVLMTLRQTPPLSIKEGTPLIQVIPFERTDWDLTTMRLGNLTIEELTTFREEYWSCKNRIFDEGADTSNPEQGHGAFAKLVKVNSRFQ
ncbi:MAG: hypothetical protein VB875_11740 [Pirellulales bacterium]